MDLEWETRVRMATFDHLRRLRDANDGAVPSGLLEERLVVDDVSIAIMSGQRGIHKPAELSAALTLKTSVSGPYDDRVDVGEAAAVRYHYRDPATDSSRARSAAARDNEAVRLAQRNLLPVAYLMGVDKGWYLPFAPTHVVADNPMAREFTVDLTEVGGVLLGSGQSWPDLAADAPARQYQVREVRHRVHQARFRHMVLRAYRAACAMCRLQHVELLDAAHIVDDASGGEPNVSNGIALCKIHHAAFDRHILGVEPDTLRLVVRADILREVDGPMLRYGLQSMHGRPLHVPTRTAHRPAHEALATRWDRFVAT